MRLAVYGFDAPGLMLGFLGAGAFGFALGLGGAGFASGPWRIAGLAIAAVSLAPLALGLVMLIYGLYGKARMRDYMLARVPWRGDEQVLDVGTGRGLLLIGAARKLGPRGRALGVDVWRAQDLSGNSAAALLANAAAAGVSDRIEARTGDARTLKLPDASIDVVLSLYCLHNIEPDAERGRALAEIVRVLKAGGRAIVADLTPTHTYAEAFRQAGLDIIACGSRFGVALAPMWIVEARKPEV